MSFQAAKSLLLPNANVMLEKMKERILTKYQECRKLTINTKKLQRDRGMNKEREFLLY